MSLRTTIKELESILDSIPSKSKSTNSSQSNVTNNTTTNKTEAPWVSTYRKYEISPTTKLVAEKVIERLRELYQYDNRKWLPRKRYDTTIGYVLSRSL